VGVNTSGDNGTAFQFTGSQQQLYTSLIQKGQGLADLYEGALRVYWEARYPARLILAAHSLRELVNGLPKAFDLPIPVDPAFITDQVNSLERRWNRAIQSTCHQNGEWTGPIDVPLRKFLQKLHAFFEWLKTNRPKRSDVVIQMLRSTDPARIPLPETLEQQRMKAWQELRRYFSNTAHGESTTVDEFATKLDALERILLDSLFRTPSVDLSAIDRILQEG
jgi:hypothetical protein